MLKFVQTHGMGSDCTAPYDVELDRPYTVAEFINEVLTSRKNEWGEIEIKGAFSLKYRYGKTEQEIPEQYANLPVKKAHAAGGYSAMNYRLEIEFIRFSDSNLPEIINQGLYARIRDTGEIVKVHSSVTIGFNKRDQNGNWRLPPDELELREPKEEGLLWRAKILRTGEVIDIRMDRPIIQLDYDNVKNLSKYRLEEIEFFYQDSCENKKLSKPLDSCDPIWEARKYEVAKDILLTLIKDETGCQLDETVAHYRAVSLAGKFINALKGDNNEIK